METRGRPVGSFKSCERDFRIFEYGPAKVVCLCCGKIRPLSDLKMKEITTVKTKESDYFNDDEYFDYATNDKGDEIKILDKKYFNFKGWK